jgi:hypothetical protein
MNYPMLKEVLCLVGVLVPPKAIHLGNGVLNYLNIGRWFHDRKLKVPVHCPGREPLYDCVAKFVKEPASYLEFGVFKGASLRYWTTLLKHPDTFFHGFDSFEGLPEAWGLVDRLYLNLEGAMPKFDDPRVKLFKGWFADTLPGYIKGFKPHPDLVIYLDADLYSSTVFVLQQLRASLGVGTILIFDELWDREHELKAFTELLNEEKFSIECLAATRTLSQAAFRIIAMRSSEPSAHKNRP